MIGLAPNVLISGLFITIVQSAQFSFIPSPNITILQSAVYQCTVDEIDPSDIVSLAWSVNGTSSSSPSWPSFITNYSIVVDGVGAHSSTLTIPGDSTALNETTVKCVAAGLVNGGAYLNTDNDTLYIQDGLANVNLNCSHQSVYTIKCTWSAPYTLPGVDITGYNINISNETSYLIMMTVNETEYTYNVSEFGDYTISVAAVIGELEGEIDLVEVTVPEETIDNCSVGVLYKNYDRLHTNCTIKDIEITSSCECISRVILNTRSQLFEETNSINMTFSCTSSPDGIIAEADISNDKRDRQDVYIMIEYKSGLWVNSSTTHSIRTFDVQDINIANNYSTGLVCFECVFIPGKVKPRCYIEYNSSESDFKGSITIDNSRHCQYINIGSDDVDQNDGNDLYNNCNDAALISSEYSVAGYDVIIDGDGPEYDIRRPWPAYETNANIIGRNCTTPPSSSTDSYSTTQSPTTTTSTTTSNVPTSTASQATNTAAIIIIGGTIGGVATGVLCCVVIIVGLLTAIHIRHILIKKKKDGSRKEPQDNYIEASFDDYRPRPQLSIGNGTSFPYVSVDHTQADQGYKKIQHFRQEIPMMPTFDHVLHDQRDISSCLNTEAAVSVPVTDNPCYESVLIKKDGGNNLHHLVNDHDIILNINPIYQ